MYWKALKWIQMHYNTILKTLNPKKATGCDQIPVKFLKHASFKIAPVISNIINKALDEVNFPNILKKAEMILVYKKSDKLNKSTCEYFTNFGKSF